MISLLSKKCVSKTSWMWLFLSWIFTLMQQSHHHSHFSMNQLAYALTSIIHTQNQKELHLKTIVHTQSMVTYAQIDTPSVKWISYDFNSLTDAFISLPWNNQAWSFVALLFAYKLIIVPPSSLAHVAFSSACSNYPFLCSFVASHLLANFVPAPAGGSSPPTRSWGEY